MKTIIIVSKELLPSELTVIADDNNTQVLFFEGQSSDPYQIEVRIAEINVDKAEVRNAMGLYHKISTRTKVEDLTNKITEVKRSNPITNLPMGIALLVLTLVTLLAAIFGHDWPTVATVPDYAPTAALIGEAFLGEFLLPFEVAGILLLAALLAAVVVARKEIKDLDEDDPSREQTP